MLKKVILFLVLVGMISSLYTGCGGGKIEESADTTKLQSMAKIADTSSPESETKSEITYKAILRLGSNVAIEEPSLLDKLLKEKFNIVIDWDDIEQAEYDDKVRLLFTAGEIPDILFGIPNMLGKELAADGFMLPVDNYIDSLPNYLKIWDDIPGGWDYVYSLNKNADGYLYYLPPKRIRVASMSWIYRKGSFDDMGLSFPRTMDELYNVLKIIKQKYPDSIPIANRDGLGYLLRGFLYAYRVQPTVVSDDYVDVDTKKLVTFGSASDRFREAIKMISRMYSEGLIDKEFPTSTQDQWREKHAAGKTYIEFTWGTLKDDINKLVNGVDPNANWVWSEDMITAYPEQGYMYYREGATFGDVMMLTNKLPDEKLARILSYIDWSATDEGSDFLSWGAEGVTYETVNGVRKFLPHMFTVNNPTGKNAMSYTRYWQDAIPKRAREAHLATGQGAVTYAVGDNFNGKEGYAFFDTIPWDMTVDEESRIKELTSSLRSIRDEYVLKFIMGQLNPADDKTWNDYINTLNKAGLEELSALRTKLYDKLKK